MADFGGQAFSGLMQKSPLLHEANTLTKRTLWHLSLFCYKTIKQKKKKKLVIDNPKEDPWTIFQFVAHWFGIAQTPELWGKLSAVWKPHNLWFYDTEVQMSQDKKSSSKQSEAFASGQNPKSHTILETK